MRSWSSPVRRVQTLTARPPTRYSKRSSKRSSASARRRKTQAIMGLSETILFYLLFGVAVAAAVAINGEHAGRPERVFRVATALFFWPLYIPLLLDRPARPRSGPQTQTHPDEPPDQFDA